MDQSKGIFCLRQLVQRPPDFFQLDRHFIGRMVFFQHLPFLVDLEQALDALLENIPSDRRTAAEAAFLRGYQSVKMLESDHSADNI